MYYSKATIFDKREFIKMKCDNCDKIFYDEYKFCPDCGQSATTKLSLKVLFKDTLSNYLSVDARIFRSLAPLLFRPGYLPKIFVAGKRHTFLHPARFYLFVSVIFFFLLSFIGVDDDFIGLNDQQQAVQADSLEQINVGDSGISGYLFGGNINLNRERLDSLRLAGLPLEVQLKEIGYKEGDGKIKRFLYKQILNVFIDRGENIEKVFMKTIPISLFFMLPIFAFLLKLFHRKKGPFSDHLVFTFYFFSLIFIFMIIIEVIGLVMDMPNDLLSLFIIGFFFYLVFGVAHFYNQKKIKSFWKSSLIASIFTFFIIPISLVIMTIASFLIY